MISNKFRKASYHAHIRTATCKKKNLKITLVHGCYTSDAQRYSGKAMIICWNAPFYHIHRPVDA